jgi:hypothetical protein
VKTVGSVGSGHGGRSGRMSSSTLMVEAIMCTLSETWKGECLLVALY